jgi:hypothetical protein
MSNSKTINATICFAVLFALLLTSTNVQARRAKPLIDPPKESLSCNLSEKQLKKGIADGMISYNWVPEFQSAYTVFGEIVVRNKHTLRVKVTYDSSHFDVDYVSSDNLKYSLKKGIPYLHPNGNKWMANLNNAILVNLTLECE